MVNWHYYRKLLDEKISDSWYNWEQAEKKAREAKAAYEAVIREKESFETALDEKLGDGTTC